MKTKIDVISGFLGAGKTTFIKKMLVEAYSGEKVVVIENEFGRVSIDGDVLKDSGVIVRELTAGCICCSLYGDFTASIIEVIKNFSPERIIIEPTGIAMLSEITESLKDKRFEGLIDTELIVTLIDVKRFKFSILCSKEFVENQIRAAGGIILSKINEAMSSDVNEVLEYIKNINPVVKIINENWDNTSADKMIASILGQKTDSHKDIIVKKRLTRTLRHAEVSIDRVNLLQLNTVHEKSANKFNSCEFETTKRFSEENVKDIFMVMRNEAQYGTVVRGKGIFEGVSGTWIKFDYVSGDLKFEYIGHNFLGKVCIIGINLDKEKILKLFNKF